METIKIAQLDIDESGLLQKLADLRKSIEDTQADSKRLRDEMASIEAQGKKGSEQWERNSKAIEQNKIVLDGLSAEYKNNQQVLINNNRVSQDHLGTIERLELQNKELRASLRALNLETEDGKKKQAQYIDQINKNTDFIRKNSDAYVQQKMNIGNYKSAIEGVGSSLVDAGKNLLSFGGAAGVLMLAVNKLKDAFFSTSQGLDLLNTTAEISKTVFYDLAHGMLPSIQRMNEAAKIAKEANELRKEDMVDALTLAKLEDKVSEARFAAADQTKSQADKLQNLNKAYEAHTEKIAFQKKEILEDIAVAKQRLELRKNDENAMKELSRLTVEYINLQREEKDEFRRVQSTRTGILADMAKDDAKYKEGYAAWMAEIEQMNAEAAQKEKERQSELRELNLLRGAEMVEAAKRELNEIIEVKKQEAIGLRNIETITLIENEENKLAIREASNEDMFAVERDRLLLQEKMEIEQAQKTGAAVGLIETKFSEYRKRLAREEQKSKMLIYADFAGSLEQLFGENTAIGRIAAVTQATINTYLGATSAFAQTPGGIIVKSLAAGTAIASGLASVKKIISTKSGLKGDSGAGSAQLPSAGTAATEPAPAPSTVSYFDTGRYQNVQPVLVLDDFQKVEDIANQVRAVASI